MLLVEGNELRMITVSTVLGWTYTVWTLFILQTCDELSLIFAGNALGMIGVSSGVAATVGLLAPTHESLIQMAACIGTGM